MDKFKKKLIEAKKLIGEKEFKKALDILEVATLVNTNSADAYLM